ncbi:MAG: DUF3786 domain-containing protein [Desulfobacterales bacterium]
MLKKLGKTNYWGCGIRISDVSKVCVQLIIYEGDDEFEPEANILFDATAGEFLSPEDAAWLGVWWCIA